MFHTYTLSMLIMAAKSLIYVQAGSRNILPDLVCGDPDPVETVKRRRKRLRDLP